jgi:hypothetical protein
MPVKSNNKKPAPKPAPAPEPAAEPAVNAADLADSADAAAEKRPRIQLASVLSINISQARCATHLKQNLGDEKTEEDIRTLRKQMKAAKEGGDNEGAAALKATIAEKSKNIVRISSETPIAAAVIWDGAVKELLIHGMDQAIAADRKIVDASHLHEGSPETLVHYSLYSKCEIWSEYDQDHEEGLKKERAASNKAAKEAREAKKAAEAPAAGKASSAKVAPGKARPKAAAKAVEVELHEDEDDEHSEHTKTTFTTYVESALKAVKRDEKYSSMRVSNRVREYLSELVSQGIARQALLARIVVQRVMGVRTMNADHVKAVVHVLMADDGRTEEQIESVTSQIDEKLETYHDHLRAEKEKKTASFDDEKKTDIERKRREADLNRKKKQTELAKKRAVEAANKAKELTAETAKLEPLVAADRAAAEAEAAA